MRNRVFFIFLMLSNFCIKAQTNISAFIESTLILVSEDKTGKASKFSVQNAYLILNTSSGDFTLNADLSDIKTGDKKQDSLVKSYGEQVYSFKGNIGENLMVFNQQQNDERSYPLPGVLNLNGNSVACVAQFDPINLAEKSESKNYRMDFTLTVESSKLAIKGLENILSRQIVFEVVGGKLNVQQ